MRTSANSFQERFIGDEAIVILRVAALLHQDVDLLSFQLLSEGQENVFKLTQHHRAVLHFVVEFQALDEVLVGAGVFRLLHLGVDGEELLKLKELFSFLLGTTELLNHLESGVHVQTSEAVAKVEQVHAGLALKVIDVKGELCSFNILGIEIMSHV